MMHKYFLLFLAFFIFGLHLGAQVEYGTITYTKTNDVVVKTEEDDDLVSKEIREMMAQMRASGAFAEIHLATFTPEGFTCVQQEKKSSSKQMETTSGMIIRVETDNSTLTHYHTDLKAKEVTNTEFIFDKKFLVNGPVEMVHWTLTGEKIPPSEATAGLDLLVATGISSSGDTLRAGYAPSLPVQVGPKNYYGLPGAIILLELQKGGQITRYQATGIELSPTPLELLVPTEGKKTTPSKYLKDKKKRQKASQKTMIRFGG